jgi:secondary thiamine-phosphate synthase enzyme
VIELKLKEGSMSKKREISVPTDKYIQVKDITHQVQTVVQESGVSSGICVVYCPHTTAGLAVNENADPDVCSDLERAFEAVVPKVRFDHMEGNSPSHFLSCFTGSSLQILIESGRLQLGRWQGIFFCDFDGPRHRRAWVKIIEG